MRSLPVPHDFVLRALDRPARAALELSRRSPAFTLAPAILGISLLVACAAIADALMTSREGAPRFDLLRGALESLLLVVPGSVVLGTWLKLRLPPRMLIGAVALGMLTAGVVCVSFVPLMLFLAVVSSEAPRVMLAAVALAPLLCVGIGAATMIRVVDAADDSRRAWLFARGYALLLFAVFALRIPQIVRVIEGGLS